MKKNQSIDLIFENEFKCNVCKKTYDTLDCSPDDFNLCIFCFDKQQEEIEARIKKSNKMEILK